MIEPTQTVLTPAQVEVIEEMLEDREARVIAYVNDSMTVLRQEFAAQLDTLRQQMATDLATRVAYGERLALRAGNAQAISAVQSNFSHEVSSIRWEWRTDVGHWESFTVERGQ